MKIVVLVKPTPDTEAKIDPNAGDLGLGSLKYIINPYDEYAIEQALLFKEAGKAEEVVVVSYTNPNNKDVLVKSLAMGADRAVLVKDENTGMHGDSLHVAKILQAVVEKEAPSLVIAGKQAIDDDNMQVGVMLAGALGWAHSNVVTTADIDGDHVKVSREAEGGRIEKYSLKMPAILGAHKSLNKPRFTSLPGIMKAKKKPFEELSVGDLKVQSTSQVSYTSFSAPPEKPPGKILKDIPAAEMVEQLVQYLKNDAKVL